MSAPVVHFEIGCRDVERAKKFYGGLLGWTANDPQTVLRLAEAGVDAIVSDDPGMALEVLEALEVLSR